MRFINAALLLLCFGLSITGLNALVSLKMYNLRSAEANSSFSFDESIDESIVLGRNEPAGSIRFKRVENLFDDFEDTKNWTSYTGYVKLNESCNSQMFGWYFQHQEPDVPLLVWLQGGPGASSMMALFLENGPFVVQKDLTVKQRPIAWTDKYSVLYIDNPVGTGFSFTDNRTECYAHSVEDSVKGVYQFLVTFVSHFNIEGTKLILAGESYGGKYVPALADHIVRKKESKKYFDLRGIIVGNGWIDPANQIEVAPFLYQLALIDDRESKIMTRVQNEVKDLIRKEAWIDAFKKKNLLIDGDLGQPSLFSKFTGYTYYLNFLNANDPDPNYWIDYLNLDSTRQAIGVGNTPFSDGHLVEYHMRQDICQTNRPRLEYILNAGLEVLLYNGNLDVIVAPVLSEQMIKVMNWRNKTEYNAAERQIWKVDPNDIEVAGYIKEAANFHYAVVRDAGHLAPANQARAVFDLVSRFIESATE